MNCSRKVETALFPRFWKQRIVCLVCYTRDIILTTDLVSGYLLYLRNDHCQGIILDCIMYEGGDSISTERRWFYSLRHLST